MCVKSLDIWKENQKCKAYRKIEVVIALIAFLLIVQSVGENTGMKEDPHIEEGKTIDVNK